MIFIYMKDFKRLQTLINQMETDLIMLYPSGEDIEFMKEAPEYIAVSMVSLILDREHFLQLGMVVGEAWQSDRSRGHAVALSR